MRRLLSIGVAVAALIGVSATHAAAAHAGNARVRLTLVTLPRIAGVHFFLDGEPIVTGKTGTARIETTRGSHLLSLLDTTVSRSGGAVVSYFKRWGEGKHKFSTERILQIEHDTTLTVGFQQWVHVNFAFTDLSGRSVVGVSKLTLHSTQGSRISFPPSYPKRLQATVLVRRYSGLVSEPVQYRIDQALVDGANVVNQAQQRFYPAQTRSVPIQVLLYSARISVRDFIFGTAAGSSLDLVYPDGTRVSQPLHGGRLVLSSLPRGTYQVRVHAGGYVPAVSLALSRNQVLQVKVVSYLDMLLFLGLGLAVLIALVLIPRPFLRLRLRSLGTGRRPTLDDLEPAKPLSGERRQLVFRYMVPRPASAATPRARSQAQAGRPLVALDAAANDAPLPQPARRPREAAAERLLRLQAVLRRLLRPRMRPSDRTPAPQEVLSGERLELIHVYMGEVAPARKTAAPLLEAQHSAGVPGVGDDDAGHASTPPETRTGAFRVVTAAWFAVRQGATLVLGRDRRRLSAASDLRESASTASITQATPTSLAALGETTAPAERSLPPALEPEPEPNVSELHELGESSVAAPTPSRPEPAKDETSTKPAQRRAPARRRAPAAKKSAATAKAKKRAPTTRTPSGSSKQKTKTTQPNKPVAADALPTSNGGTEDLSLLRPDLAAAVETLQEDLRKARRSASPSRRKRTASAKDTAPAKPKRARSSAKQKTATTKKAAAATPSRPKTSGTANPKTKTTKANKPPAASRSSNGGTEDLSLLRPDLAAAVEALQEDLRNARTSTQTKSRRKSGTRATR